MQSAYIDYSMSVIVARALPDVRDGFKPVHRRVLFGMDKLGNTSDKPYKKSARIVGEVLGKYHPHGDSSIYETLVVMSQDFKKGMALVDGHGNFGSIEGDGAAAMRYTEARLKKFAEEVYLKDLDKTVEFVSNYDETEKEPEVLPVRVPNLLINGAEGIAVGMSTSIPPHNLGEVIDAVKAGAIKHFFLVGGCDGSRPGRNYYTEFVKQTPKDTVVLTLACGKYRFNDLDLGTIGGLPRLMDIGQCNDAYSAIQIAVALAEAFGCGVNDLPLSMVLSWYEQKAVCILLTLLHLGIKNIRLGPTLPAFVSSNVLNFLVEKFHIAPITTPEEDLKAILGA